MNKASARWLAWSFQALYVIIAVPMVGLQLANRGITVADAMLSALILLTFVSIGVLIATRQPANPIGWLFCAAALVDATGVLAVEYAVYALKTAPGMLPGGVWAGLFGAGARGTGWFLILTYLLLLFPNGRLPSRRWRPVAWAVAVGLILFTAMTLFTVAPFDIRIPNVHSPVALVRNPALSSILQTVSTLPLVVLIGICGIALIVRFRGSHGMERDQLKWLLYAIVLVLVFVLGIFAVTFFTLVNIPGWVFFLSVMPIPVGTGIAILRHRLYDIDLVINRTLVYGSLTAILAAVYFGSVLGMQQIAVAVAGRGATQQPLILVLSTLLIAALFQPLRGRLQHAIDRRFYRGKYNAAKTLERFAATLRSEVDLADLSEQLLAVVEETMRPAHVSLWLREQEPLEHPLV